MKRRDMLFIVLGAFFLTNAIVAELIGGKLIYVLQLTPDQHWGPFGPDFAMSVGILPWPVVFLTTDIINEFYGRKGVRRLTYLTIGMILYAFFVLWLTMQIPAAGFSPVDDESYRRVYGQSMWIIAGSITAFALGQLIDVTIFHLLRKKTGKAQIWIRATGSTLVSQLIDTVVVLYIGLYLGSQFNEDPAKRWTLQTYANTALPNYAVKVAIAFLATPLIYAGHWAVERFLGHEEAESMAETAAQGL